MWHLFITLNRHVFRSWQYDRCSRNLQYVRAKCVSTQRNKKTQWNSNIKNILCAPNGHYAQSVWCTYLVNRCNRCESSRTVLLLIRDENEVNLFFNWLLCAHLVGTHSAHWLHRWESRYLLFLLICFAFSCYNSDNESNYCGIIRWNVCAWRTQLTHDVRRTSWHLKTCATPRCEPNTFAPNRDTPIALNHR